MSFLITGEWLTAHARERVFEYGADDALRFLTTSVVGLDAAMAGEVLDGSKRVVGDTHSEIDVVPDDAPEGETLRGELAARYRWHFAGVWFDRSTKKYRRPYAVVTGWGEDDTRRPTLETGENCNHSFPAGRMVSRLCGGDMESWSFYRCVRYMNDRVHDLCVRMQVPGRPPGEEMVLWSNVDAPPLWWPVARDPAVALAAYLAEFGSLDERGAHIEYARERKASERAKETLAAAGIVPPVAPEPAPEPPAEPRPLPRPTADLLRELLPDDTPKHVAEGIMRTMTDDETPKPVRVTDPTEAPYAWVARDGGLWLCRGYMDHKATALGVAEALGMSLDRWQGNGDHALGELGWAKVGRDAQNEPFAWIDPTKTPTDPQFDAVVRWLVHNKADPLDVQAWANSRKRPE